MQIAFAFKRFAVPKLNALVKTACSITPTHTSDRYSPNHRTTKQKQKNTIDIRCVTGADKGTDARERADRERVRRLDEPQQLALSHRGANPTNTSTNQTINQTTIVSLKDLSHENTTRRTNLERPDAERRRAIGTDDRVIDPQQPVHRRRRILRRQLLRFRFEQSIIQKRSAQYMSGFVTARPAIDAMRCDGA